MAHQYPIKSISYQYCTQIITLLHLDNKSELGLLQVFRNAMNLFWYMGAYNQHKNRKNMFKKARMR